jgi:hypothetical protein
MKTFPGSAFHQRMLSLKFDKCFARGPSRRRDLKIISVLDRRNKESIMTLLKSVLKFRRAFYLAIVMTLLCAEPAYAYADPGTGGLLYQILIISLAVIASYVAFLKGYLKDFLGRAFRKGPGKNPDDEDQ